MERRLLRGLEEGVIAAMCVMLGNRTTELAVAFGRWLGLVRRCLHGAMDIHGHGWTP